MTTSTTSIGGDFAAIVARMEGEAEALSRMAADGVWNQVPLAATADLVVSLLKTGDALSGGVGIVHTSGTLPAGPVSTRRWLEVATGMSARSAGVKVARSMSLRDGFARTRLAWLAGRISDDMARVITTGIPLALQRLNVAQQPSVIERIEAQIVPYAFDHSIAKVQKKLKQLRLTIDPDGIDERSLAAYDEQQLHLAPGPSRWRSSIGSPPNLATIASCTRYGVRRADADQRSLTTTSRRRTVPGLPRGASSATTPAFSQASARSSASRGSAPSSIHSRTSRPLVALLKWLTTARDPSGSR
jgi:hypothetical protein